jgi:hypothetical protein
MPSLPNQNFTIFSVPDQARSRTSDVVVLLIDRTRQEDVTLRNLTDRLGDRTFGMLLVLMAVFNFIPLVSVFFGVLISLLGMQMVVGMKSARLPKMVLDRQLSPERVRAALQKIEPKLRSIEKYIRPRWLFTEAPIIDRINGLVVIVLGAIITVPIPFTNLVPALLVILMGVGLLERDGLVQVAAASFGLIFLIIFTFLVFGH